MRFFFWTVYLACNECGTHNDPSLDFSCYNLTSHTPIDRGIWDYAGQFSWPSTASHTRTQERNNYEQNIFA
jgi:hypothetical protein